MKKLLAVLSLLLVTSVFARDLKECEQWVEDNLGTFAICAPHNIVENDSAYWYRVEECKKTTSGITCEVIQNFPSSNCTQEIYLDHRCYFNTGAKIIMDQREDL